MFIKVCEKCGHPADWHTLGYDASICNCGCYSRLFETVEEEDYYQDDEADVNDYDSD